MRRLGLNRLASLAPPEPVVRYERSRPGSLVHMDIKKLARIVRPGHRIDGDRSRTVKGAGWLGKLTRLDRLSLAGNQLTGPIPPSLGNLANVRLLWLAENQLTGTMPPELGQLESLQSLSLRDNQLAGAIPPSIGDLETLQSLDVSRNPGLSGPLPASLAGLHALDILWITGTDLCVPRDAHFETWLANVNFDGERCPPPGPRQ